MKRIFFLFLTLIAVRAFAQTQPALEMVIFPKYIEGGNDDYSGSGRNGIPYVYRAKISGLKANKTYRYDNSVYIATVGGQPTYMMVVPPANVPANPAPEAYTPGNFYRPFVESPYAETNINVLGSLSTAYGTFATDNNGTYTGWFIQETITRWSLGSQVYLRIALNDPDASDPAAIAYRLFSPESQPLIVMGIDTLDNEGGQMYGTAIRSTPATSGVPKNFVFLYDNTEGTGRPVAGTIIEDDGLAGRRAEEFETNGYATFYTDHVDGINGAWGTMIPNTDAAGIKRIEQRSITDGSIVGVNTSDDGFWADGLKPGGTVATALTHTGANRDGNVAIVIDGSDVDLSKPKLKQTLHFTSVFSTGLKFGDVDFTVTAESDIPAFTAGIVYSASPAGVFEISGNTVKIIGGGTAIITASHPGDDIYASAKISRELTVTKSNQTIDNFTDLSKNYGDAAFTLPLNTSAGLPVTYKVSGGDADVIVIDGNNISIKAAGTVNITASQAGNNATNAATDVTVALTVARAPLTIQADNKATGLGQGVPALTYTIAGFKYNDAAEGLATPVSISTTAPAEPSEGKYDITVSGATSPNYIITFVNSKLTVYGSAQNVTFAPLVSKVYGDNPFDPGAVSVDVPGNKPVYTSSNALVAIIENGLVKITGAGTTIITASFPETGSFPPATLDQPLLVNKKELIATAAAASRMYGHADPAFTATYSGFVNGDGEAVITTQPSYTTNATLASPVGAYLVTPKAAASANYYFTYSNGPFTIEKAVLTVTAENKTRKYGEANPALTVVYSDFLNGDTEALITTKATASVSATSTTAAGTYPIIPSGAAAANYTFNSVNGTLVISATDRTIKFDPLPLKKVGDADFDPSAIVSTGETAVYTSLNPSVATIVNGKLHIVSSGSALIRASAPVNANYNTAPSAEQTLTIGRNSQTISFEVIPVLSAGSASYTIKATSSSGLPVTFSLVNSSLAGITGNKLTPLAAGTTQINAMQNGDASYLPAQVVTHTLTIAGGNGNGGLVQVHPAVSPNGDGVNDFLVLDGITDYPQNKVKIVNRNGIEVYSAGGYDNVQQVFRGRSASGKILPQGTYFCLIEFNANGSLQHITGYFILK